MATKMIVFAALFCHSVFAYSPSVTYKSHEHHDDDHYAHAPAPYHFEYDVKDTHTRDIKTQHEVSDGHGNVKGTYSLVEPDGSTRVVEYTADHEHGFNAKVKKIGAPYYHGDHSEAVDYHHHDDHKILHRPHKSSSYFKSY